MCRYVNGYTHKMNVRIIYCSTFSIPRILSSLHFAGRAFEWFRAFYSRFPPQIYLSLPWLWSQSSKLAVKFFGNFATVVLPFSFFFCCLFVPFATLTLACAMKVFNCVVEKKKIIVNFFLSLGDVFPSFSTPAELCRVKLHDDCNPVSFDWPHLKIFCSIFI